MPFTPYKSSLDPDALMVAQEAFARAWEEIFAGPGGYDQDQVRNLLAKRIMECALEHGECDPEKLKACALDGFKP
jgi:hypothetical protein